MPTLLQLRVLVAMVTAALCQDGPAEAPGNQVCLIVPPAVEECYKSYTDKPISERAAQVACLQELLWNFEPIHDLSDLDLGYFRSLRGAGPDPNSTYIPSTALPPSGYRVRREYRTLSDGERRRFHDAMNVLYESGVIRRFAELSAEASTSHHIGASFLPWNRVFLTMFEEALRKVDRHVFLPYWDSTIDHEMDNAVNSDLWTPKFFGTGTGDVVSGLGAGWVTHQGHLQRDYGTRSRLMAKAQIRDIMSRCSLKEISRPTASPLYDLELIQGGPHAWVGGDMAYPATAGYDPIFYLHQAYVDYVWELFRLRQSRRCGVHPTSDYPEVPEGDSHHPDAPMTGFDWLTNRDGIEVYWIENWYRYDTHPICPNCCPTCQSPAPMNCDRSKNVCVSRSRRVYPFSEDRSTIPARDAFLEMSELTSLVSIRAPRNRGLVYEHLPTDGRTLATANIDAARTHNAIPSPPRSRPQSRPIHDQQTRVSPHTGQQHHSRTQHIPDQRHNTVPRGGFIDSRQRGFERSRDTPMRSSFGFRDGQFRRSGFSDRDAFAGRRGALQGSDGSRSGVDRSSRPRMVSPRVVLGQRDYIRLAEMVTGVAHTGRGTFIGTGNIMGSRRVSETHTPSLRDVVGVGVVTGTQVLDSSPATLGRSGASGLGRRVARRMGGVVEHANPGHSTTNTSREEVRRSATIREQTSSTPTPRDYNRSGALRPDTATFGSSSVMRESGHRVV